jgi:hypothetical protein
MRGYYLWNWYGTYTIKYCEDSAFYCEYSARNKDAYRRFADCKKRGIQDMEARIAKMQRQLECLKKAELSDVRPHNVNLWKSTI